MRLNRRVAGEMKHDAPPRPRAPVLKGGDVQHRSDPTGSGPQAETRSEAPLKKSQRESSSFIAPNGSGRRTVTHPSARA